jgi:hypothetical protein
MTASDKKTVQHLISLAGDFSAEKKVEKYEALLAVQKIKWKAIKEIEKYAELLLFMAAHPGDSMSLFQVEKNMQALAAQLKAQKAHTRLEADNTGLPFTNIVTVFSHDLLEWMLDKKEWSVSIDSYTADAKELSEVLKFTLPSVERDRTSLGYDDAGLLKSLQVKEQGLLSFIASELSVLNLQPILKDHLFESLGIYLKVNSKSGELSKFHNRFLKREVFFHDEVLKRFDSEALLNASLPEPEVLSASEKEHLMSVIRTSLVLTARETDPSTFMQLSSLRLYALERGVAVAIYGMIENRQLSLESYVGFTMFKNGFPCAYGGSWIFGKRALFGMNIFEQFRGGESGFIMCQLLRVYRQAFGISVFEVEPYQFGKDNPDGIKSGAFWFYYKYGFRPQDKTLRKLAESEKRKIGEQKGYFSTYKTLERFTESYLELAFEPAKQKSLSELSEKVTRMIHATYNDNRVLAKQKSLQHLKELLPTSSFVNGPALEEWSLVREALNITDAAGLNIIAELAHQKANDVYRYQTALLKFL